MPTDYSTRIADQFLEKRAHLGAALFSLSALADESLATMPAAAQLRAMQAHLRRPFVFLAVGEASAGKSSLLNALFGREFSDPDEHRTCIFRYGDEATDTPLTSSLVEHCRPLPFLRDFQLVDTAAASEILSDHEARIEELAPQADLIIFAVSALDPWSASAWDLIEAVYDKWRKEIVVVVQHADERPPREIEAITRHVAHTAAGRFRREAPVFPVSANKAFLARTSGLDRERLWRESGFARLEACIDEIVGGARGRGGDLPAAASAARAVLQDIAAGVRQQAGDVRAEQAAVASADALIAQTHTACDALMDGLRQRLQMAAARCQRQGENLLRIHVSGWRLAGLRSGNRWARSFKRNVAGLLRTAFRREAETALNAMIARFQEAADGLLSACDRPVEAVGGNLYSNAAREVGIRCRTLAEEVELTLAEHLAQDAVELGVHRRLARSAGWARAAIVLTVLGVLAAAGAAAGAGLLAGEATAVATMAAAVGACVCARRNRQAAMAVYRDANPSSQATLIATIEASFRAAAAGCCALLREALAPLSAHCARRDERVRPICDQVEGLENTFSRIAARR